MRIKFDTAFALFFNWYVKYYHEVEETPNFSICKNIYVKKFNFALSNKIDRMMWLIAILKKRQLQMESYSSFLQKYGVIIDLAFLSIGIIMAIVVTILSKKLITEKYAIAILAFIAFFTYAAINYDFNKYKCDCPGPNPLMGYGNQSNTLDTEEESSEQSSK